MPKVKDTCHTFPSKEWIKPQDHSLPCHKSISSSQKSWTKPTLQKSLEEDEPGSHIIISLQVKSSNKDLTVTDEAV